MFNIKISSIFAIIVFLFLGCEESTKVIDSDSSSKKNTLNDPGLDPDPGQIEDYFYNFDEGVEAKFLYYNSYITRGANTINSKSGLNPYLDTLSFRTFPYYTIGTGDQLDTVSYLLNLTPENIDSYSTLYPLDETNTGNLDWCNKMLVEYAGNCPETVEVNFDYSILLSSVTGKDLDTTISRAVFNNILSIKEVTFDESWSSIKSLIWDNNLNRYDVITEDSIQVLSATLVDSTDFFDSLIYVGIIDTSRFVIEGLMLVDRIEWERYDVEFKSVDKPIKLDTTFTYERVKVPDNSPMYRINGDCNQNLIWDKKEPFEDWGSDWCPDSLETGVGKCDVVDTNGDGSLFDEVPCNCYWDGIIGSESELNAEWVANNNLDPNGDNWGDCGWDGYCPGHPDDTNGDENGTEKNDIWDTFERFEKNGQYDFDILTGTGEYFIDKGNGVFYEPAEFCVKGDNGECDSSDPFEDRNCNGKWDDVESGDTGNGIWDDDEAFQNLDNSIETDSNSDRYGKPTWNDNEPLYALGDRLETLIVDYSDQNIPVQITELDTNTTVTLYFGTTDNSIYKTYSNFLERIKIEAEYEKNFHNIERKETIYTNKIVEYSLPGAADNYHVTKTKWYQDIGGTQYIEDELANPQYGKNYGYDYHLFKIAENGNIIKMVHPAFFNYYGYNYLFNTIETGSWRTEFPQEEIYIYTYNGQLRSGEYYYSDTTLITEVADYYVEDLYEVIFDQLVVLPFKKVTYNISDSGDTTCINTPNLAWLDNPAVDITIEANYRQNCPPVDTTLTNTYKITKTKTIIMIGSGLEFGLRNTIWLGSDAGSPLGIVKDQLEIRWSEPYWEEYGSGWFTLSRLELRSIQKTGSESSRLSRIFQPIKHLSLNDFSGEVNFNNDPFILNPSFGIHRVKIAHE